MYLSCDNSLRMAPWCQNTWLMSQMVWHRGWMIHSCTNMHGVNNINYQWSSFVVPLGEEMDPDCELSLGDTVKSTSPVYCCTPPAPQTTTAHSEHCLSCHSCIIRMLHDYRTATIYHSLTSVPWWRAAHCGMITFTMGDQQATSFSRIFSFLIHSLSEKKKRNTESATLQGWIKT